VTFPVEFTIGGQTVHAHLLMETAGYVAGARLYFYLGRRMKGPKLDADSAIWIVASCLLGAVVGAKLLALVESIHTYWPLRHDPQVFFGGKTIAGGLAGGWAGVEIAKRLRHIHNSTGDRFVFPIILGICVGRVGCFLEGLPDHTYGVATSLPWGVNFGDGVSRHPTQLYEIIFCALLGLALLWRIGRPHWSGEIFRLFMLGYFSWRFAVEFIKPRETYLGLSPIQMTSFIVVCCALYSLRRHAGSVTAGRDVAMDVPPEDRLRMNAGE
jgi:phosphatidylglycerol---prolipoprotein diacylglyceryl transferase